MMHLGVSASTSRYLSFSAGYSSQEELFRNFWSRTSSYGKSCRGGEITGELLMTQESGSGCRRPNSLGAATFPGIFCRELFGSYL